MKGIAVVSSFVLGFCCCLIFFLFLYMGVFNGFSMTGNVVFNGSPSNWITEKDLVVESDRLILEIANVSIGRYLGSGSMQPVLDSEVNGIRIVPESDAVIEVGDIVTYERNGDTIIHRVIEKGLDGDGVYFIVKGDNNILSDGKVRFSEIRYVTIGILY
ncbi:MAG: signal peptidase I [Patescibacteria group bacterium]|jgi:signal peptidase I